MKKDLNKLLDELVEELTGLKKDKPSYEEVIAAAERVREANQRNKKHMTQVDKYFYDALHDKKD